MSIWFLWTSFIWIVTCDICVLLKGIMGILSGSLGQEFFLNCYTPLGEMMDMMTLVNCMINFILYCTMSRQFRQTFRWEILREKTFCIWNNFFRKVFHMQSAASGLNDLSEEDQKLKLSLKVWEVVVETINRVLLRISTLKSIWWYVGGFYWRAHNEKRTISYKNSWVWKW